MSLWLRLLAPAPLVVAGFALAAVTGGHEVVAIATLPTLLAWLSGRRVSLSVPAQVLVLIACAMVAAVLAPLLPAAPGLGSDVLRPTWAQLGVAALLLAGVRLHLRAPVLGLAGSYGAGVLVFITCGTVQSGALFPIAGVVYMGLAFLALALDAMVRGARPSALHLDGRNLVATSIVLAVTAGMTIALAAAIPRFYAAVYELALSYIDQRHRAGFHDGAMQLGALDGLLASSEVVMRVRGDVGERLRGNVYVHYSRGRWLSSSRRTETTRRETSVEAARERGDPIRAEVWWAGDQHDRFFLPTTPGRLALSPAEVRVDDLGVVRTQSSEPAEELLLLDEGVLDEGEGPFTQAPPRAADLALAEDLREELAPLVASWTRGLVADADRLAALEARLEGHYAYSLDFAHRGSEDGGDPVLTFLRDERKGHCEYFASAITLLARSAGLPARLVTGYRVAERNRIGDYAIVRERHAHAWSEVHLEGRGWVSVDPSPLAGTAAAPSESTPMLPGLLDYALLQWHTRGLEVLLVVLVVGLASVQVIRILRGRSASPQALPPAVPPPPGWLAALLDRLSQRGHERAPSETIEALARRVQAAEVLERVERAPLGEAASLLRRYAAFRYGGEGDAEVLRRDVERFLVGAAGTAPIPPGSSP